jgi:hypothetical protein
MASDNASAVQLQPLVGAKWLVDVTLERSVAGHHEILRNAFVF